MLGGPAGWATDRAGEDTWGNPEPPLVGMSGSEKDRDPLKMSGCL